MAPRLFGISLAWVPAAAGPVWLLLTGLMALAAVHTARQGVVDATVHAGLIIGFIVLCWLHPVYTAVAGAFEVRRRVELAGSVVTLAVLALLLLQIRGTAPLAVLLLSPVAVWLSVATYYLAEMLWMERA